MHDEVRDILYSEMQKSLLVNVVQKLLTLVKNCKGCCSLLPRFLWTTV